MHHSHHNIYKIYHSKVRLNHNIIMTMQGFRLCAFFVVYCVCVSMTNQKVGEAVIEVVGLEEP